jgi:hypothetical protein
MKGDEEVKEHHDELFRGETKLSIHVKYRPQQVSPCSPREQNELKYPTSRWPFKIKNVAMPGVLHCHEAVLSTAKTRNEDGRKNAGTWFKDESLSR